jgi:taurine dioxygenase
MMICRTIAGLKAVHAYKSTRDKHQSTVLSPEELAKTPRALHPIARLNPDNDRPGLFLCPGRVTGIDNMDEDSAFDLLDQLYAHATQYKYLYRHKWRKGAVLSSKRH